MRNLQPASRFTRKASASVSTVVLTCAGVNEVLAVELRLCSSEFRSDSKAAVALAKPLSGVLRESIGPSASESIAVWAPVTSAELESNPTAFC
jgi:hypothetical protein